MKIYISCGQARWISALTRSWAGSTLDMGSYSYLETRSYSILLKSILSYNVLALGLLRCPERTLHLLLCLKISRLWSLSSRRMSFPLSSKDSGCSCQGLGFRFSLWRRCFLRFPSQLRKRSLSSSYLFCWHNDRNHPIKSGNICSMEGHWLSF